MDCAPPFSPEEYEQRRVGVRALMAQNKLTVLVVTAPEDVYYLSGLNNQGHFVFTALVLNAECDTVTLVARAMEAPTAAVQAPDCEFAGYQDATDPADILSEAIPHLDRGERIGHQAGSLTFPIAVWQGTDRRLGSPSWVDCTALLADVRALHTDREVAYLRRAASLSDVGMRAGIAAAAGDCSGGEVVGAIEQAMLSAGSDYPAFVPQVRPVEEIRREHVAWIDRRITAEDSLFFELSAATARYHAPMGRTVRPVGSGRDTGAAELASAGLVAIVTALRPGRAAEEVYRAWNDTVESGLGCTYERHHCGYSVGTGFPPSWMAGRVDSLRPGHRRAIRPSMTFHIQSWVVDQQLGTYAVSDTALVTADGSELLTVTPRHPARPA